MMLNGRSFKMKNGMAYMCRLIVVTIWAGKWSCPSSKAIIYHPCEVPRESWVEFEVQCQEYMEEEGQVNFG